WSSGVCSSDLDAVVVSGALVSVVSAVASVVSGGSAGTVVSAVSPPQAARIVIRVKRAANRRTLDSLVGSLFAGRNLLNTNAVVQISLQRVLGQPNAVDQRRRRLSGSKRAALGSRV